MVSRAAAYKASLKRNTTVSAASSFPKISGFVIKPIDEHSAKVMEGDRHVGTIQMLINGGFDVEGTSSRKLVDTLTKMGGKSIGQNGYRVKSFKASNPEADAEQARVTAIMDKYADIQRKIGPRIGVLVLDLTKVATATAIKQVAQRYGLEPKRVFQMWKDLRPGKSISAAISPVRGSISDQLAAKLLKYVSSGEILSLVDDIKSGEQRPLAGAQNLLRRTGGESLVSDLARELERYKSHNASSISAAQEQFTFKKYKFPDANVAKSFVRQVLETFGPNGKEIDVDFDPAGKFVAVKAYNDRSVQRRIESYASQAKGVKASISAGFGGKFNNEQQWTQEAKRRGFKVLETTHPSGAGTWLVAKDRDGNRVGTFDLDHNKGELTQDPRFRPISAAQEQPEPSPARKIAVTKPMLKVLAAKKSVVWVKYPGGTATMSLVAVSTDGSKYKFKDKWTGQEKILTFDQIQELRAPDVQASTIAASRVSSAALSGAASRGDTVYIDWGDDDGWGVIEDIDASGQYITFHTRAGKSVEVPVRKIHEFTNKAGKSLLASSISAAGNDMSTARYVFKSPEIAAKFAAAAKQMGLKSGSSGAIAVVVNPSLRAADVSDTARKFGGKPTSGAVQASDTSTNLAYRFKDERTASAFVDNILRMGLKAGYSGSNAAVLRPGLKAADVADAARKLNGTPLTKKA